MIRRGEEAGHSGRYRLVVKLDGGGINRICSTDVQVDMQTRSTGRPLVMRSDAARERNDHDDCCSTGSCRRTPVGATGA